MDHPKEYAGAFFSARNERTHYAANVLLANAIAALPPVRSVLDVGCGVGTFLATLSERGVTDVLGVDGPWVDKALLAIPQDRFEVRDVSQPLDFGRRFDLAISLEVAEHIPASSADAFVKSLANASDFVLFSAAIPGQGGKHHVNEQWPSYWAERFAKHGFRWADFRSRLWNDEKVPYWYRQNVLLYVHESRASEVQGLEVHAGLPCSLVHPTLYDQKRTETIKGGLMMTRRALKRRLGL